MPTRCDIQNEGYIKIQLLKIQPTSDVQIQPADAPFPTKDARESAEAAKLLIVAEQRKPCTVLQRRSPPCGGTLIAMELRALVNCIDVF